MIHFDVSALPAGFRQTLPRNQRTAAGWAPVRLRLLGEHRVALAADPFHMYEITGLALASTSVLVLPSTDR
jgi:hypothetical protein